MPHVNVEIKARCRDAAAVRGTLLAAGAIYRGTDHQVDTYFRVPNGRLKLREGNIENHLIFYDRPNCPGPKRADVLLLPTEPGSTVKEILTRAVGVLVTVDKHREIYFLDNVKFHIDTVEGLGGFVEIEAQSGPGRELAEEHLLAQCRRYLEMLAIRTEDLVAESYSDMLLGKGGGRRE
jgi:adenylate cyclase, class 2